MSSDREQTHTNPRVTVVTFAQLGTYRNLKTADISPVIDSLQNNGLLHQVICHSAKQAQIPHIVQAIPRWMTRFLKVLHAVSGKRFSVRRFEEILFNIHAAHRLRESDIVLVHPARFRRVIRKAQKLSAVPVGIATTEEPSAQIEKQQQEIAATISDAEAPAMAPTDKSYREYEYLIAPSEAAKVSYVQAGFPEEKVYVASMTIDTSYFTRLNNNDDDVFRVLYVADTISTKGLHYLLSAWSRFNVENAELMLAGRMKVPQELEQQYREQIDADPTVRWIGSHQDPKQLYVRASVFVHPSLSEGFGKTVVEAMSMEVPVIVSELAPGLVTDGQEGYVVPARDASAIGNALYDLYKNFALRTRMGARGRQRVEREPDFGQRVVDICQNIWNQQQSY